MKYNSIKSRNGNIKITNLLNNSQIISSTNHSPNNTDNGNGAGNDNGNNDGSDNGNKIDISAQLIRNLSQTLQANNMNAQNIKYIGRGINGYLAHATISDSRMGEQQNIVAKCYPGKLDKSRITQLRHELAILGQLQKYPATRDYVNPCLDVIIAPEITVALFPAVNGVSLRNAMLIMAEADFDPKYRHELVRFIILAVLDAVQRMHDIGISHLQLDHDAILIDLNHRKTSDNTPSKSIINNIGNKIQDMMHVNTEQETIYYVDRTPNIGIRLTNFGIGCLSRDVGCNLKIAALNDPKFPRSKLACVETGTKSKGCNTVDIGRRYDIWCCGELLLDFFTGSGCDSNGAAASNMDNMNIFKDCIKKYMIDPDFNDRRNCGFVREKIMLDIKHR